MSRGQLVPHIISERVFSSEKTQFPEFQGAVSGNIGPKKRGISLHPSEFGLIHRRISRPGELAKLLFLPSWNELNCFQFCHQYTDGPPSFVFSAKEKLAKEDVFKSEKKFKEKKDGAQLVLADEIMDKLH